MPMRSTEEWDRVDLVSLIREMKQTGWPVNGYKTRWEFFGKDDLGNPVTFRLERHPQGWPMLTMKVRMETTLIGPKMWAAVRILHRYLMEGNMVVVTEFQMEEAHAGHDGPSDRDSEASEIILPEGRT